MGSPSSASGQGAECAELASEGGIGGPWKEIVPASCAFLPQSPGAARNFDRGRGGDLRNCRETRRLQSLAGAFRQLRAPPLRRSGRWHGAERAGTGAFHLPARAWIRTPSMGRSSARRRRRAALKSIPPSIRDAALGVGASKMQAVFHHVLPLAMPGILTGTIIGLAQAFGETAPLLLIGMVAFVREFPEGILDPAVGLPVQVY
ncbi:ABC transporter permease subunit, partial [Mangrovicoccus sp. HB161399]|uniref:ABC transporter permease subunit n=1 Tax=Mangrovicoccus sp. HB161399 TaxID=2720392 RepID=UPI00211063B0